MSQEQSQLSSEMENSQSANNFMKVKEVLVDIGHLNYLNLFTENELTDDALECAEDSKEMRDLLKEIIPLGTAFKFSTRWFRRGACASSKVKESAGDDVNDNKQGSNIQKLVTNEYATPTEEIPFACGSNNVSTSSNIPTEPVCSNLLTISSNDTSQPIPVAVNSSQEAKSSISMSEDSKNKSAPEIPASGEKSEEVFVTPESRSDERKASCKKLWEEVEERPNEDFLESTIGRNHKENQPQLMKSAVVMEKKAAAGSFHSAHLSNQENGAHDDSSEVDVSIKLVKDPAPINSGEMKEELFPNLELSPVKSKEKYQESACNETTVVSRNQLPPTAETNVPTVSNVKNAGSDGHLRKATPHLHQTLERSESLGFPKSNESAEVKKKFCPPRRFGSSVSDFLYTKGNCLKVEENREVEFKSLAGENPIKLPWKIMEKARVFICGILNAGGKGTIYFGIGDSYDEVKKFQRGEVIGLAVEELKDEISKAFQFTLNDHIKSDDGKMQKAGDMDCIKICFVPVHESERHTGRYVIEIEVKRDWAHCKEKVYYYQDWKPKGNTQKGGLRDLFKVMKDHWMDPVVRTCGESTKVKNIEVEKQIREPLNLKYKKFQDDAEKNRSKLAPEIVDDEDIQMYSTRIRESLRELNIKEISYILIANKVPPEHRGSTSLAFLQSIPWMVVFDLFDPNSRKDGLHHIFNETNDSAPAVVKDLSEFKKILPSDDLPTRGTTWIERNKPMHESNWTRNSKDCLYRALSAYQERSPTGRIHCVFLGLSNDSIQEMADIIDCSFSIIGTKAGKFISIISEKKEIVDEIIKCAKQDVRQEVRERSICGYPWKLLEMNIRQMVGPSHVNERDATTELPYFDGKLKPVLTKRLNSLTDLEVYCPAPNFDNSVEQIEKARENFYKGGVVDQLNLFHNDDVERTVLKKLASRIDQCLKRLSQNSEIPCNVEIVQLRYESGSGATTLCRRILWNKRHAYRCAVVKAITLETDFQIQNLQNFLYDADMSYTPPVLILVDNFPDQDVRQLLDKISERKIKCVILNTVPISKSVPQGIEDPILELRQLDATEIQKVKQVLVNVTSKNEQLRSEAEKVLLRERRFIWLGLQLFGREYQDIEQRLTNHINDIVSQILTDESKNLYQMILRFCCLLDYYSKGRCNYPHACATDLLCDVEAEAADLTNHIKLLHDKFGGLLLETYDESNGFRDWRPAHHLVSEVVRKQMDLLSTSKELLMKLKEGRAFAKNYLINHAVTVCLDRESKFVDTSSQDDIDDETIAIDDMCGALEVRTRYSPLIEDVMRLTRNPKENTENALDILITLNENVKTTQHKARTWQQIARIVAYEIGMKSISNEDRQIDRINRLLRPGHEINYSSTKGFQIAHLVIDEAIKLQDSYVHHLVTKGAFFMAELRELEEHFTGAREITAIIKEAINTGKKGIAVYEDALKKISYNSYGYLDAMVGKFQTVVRMLEILKRLPYFTQHRLGPDESFKVYMNDDIHPEAVKAIFNEDELEYLVSLKEIAVDLSINLFEEIHFVKLRRTQLSKKYVNRELMNANARALMLSKKFYQLTRLKPITTNRKGGLEEETVLDSLSQKNETPFTSWKELTEADVLEIYDTLRNAIRKKPVRDISMLVCARAALHLQEKPSLTELSSHVDLWCKKFPKSVWAHLFNYMIHFPLPNSSLNTNVRTVKDSIAICTETSRSREGLRRSGAEYLLGKGRGLHAIVRPYEVSKNSYDIHGTKFWQSSRVFAKLERLRGRKISGRKGVLTYRNIEILFDNQRYPKDSSDDLWFCLGFTLNGPYAYDPIDNDSYKTLKTSFSGSKSEENVHTSSSTSECHSSSLRSSSEGSTEKVLNTDELTGFSPVTDAAATIPDTIPDIIRSSKTVKSDVVNVSQEIESSESSPTTKKKPLVYPEEEVYHEPHLDWLQEPSNVQSEVTSYCSSKMSPPYRAMEEPIQQLKKLAIPIRKEDGSQILFPVSFVDRIGRVHHGASVRRSLKSAECTEHLSGLVPPNCCYAHWWMGDTLQFVCHKCTNEGKTFCEKKEEHEKYIYNLGPYRNKRNEVWIFRRQQLR